MGLLAAYAVSMYRNIQSRLPIERWIFGTILLASLELLDQVAAFSYWNQVGRQALPFPYARLVLGMVKHGVSRCLFLMVSLGWGMVVDSLGRKLPIILVLGTVYTGALIANVCLVMDLVRNGTFPSLRQERQYLGIQIIRMGLGFVFFVWTVVALFRTIRTLRRTGQSRKLERIQSLRNVFLVFLLLECLITLYSRSLIYGSHDPWVQEWTPVAAHHVSFMVILSAVAKLWWPNPSARAYAFVMELPSSADGLEMTGSGGVGMPDGMVEPNIDPS
jgi:uncharacterized membrane protein